MSLASGDPRHGTNNGYQNHGCRCGRCRTAVREYRRAHGLGSYKRDRCECGGLKDTRAVHCRACESAAREAPHGTESRYVSGGCRCELCRAAATAARRQRRARAAA